MESKYSEICSVALSELLIATLPTFYDNSLASYTTSKIDINYIVFTLLVFVLLVIKTFCTQVL